MGARGGGGVRGGGGAGSGTSRSLPGYVGISRPRSGDTKVLGWVQSNKVWVSKDDKKLLSGVTFNDVKKGFNYDRADTFIRDLIYDGSRYLKMKKK